MQQKPPYVLNAIMVLGSRESPVPISGEERTEMRRKGGREEEREQEIALNLQPASPAPTPSLPHLRILLSASIPY